MSPSGVASLRGLTIATAVIGGLFLVLGVALLAVFLYRKRFQQSDEEIAVEKLQHYEFDHKDLFLLKTLQEPQVAHIPPTIRTSFVLPNSTPIRGAPRTAYESGAAYYPDTSPPPRSSIWRGKQWVTVTRPKINLPPPPRKNRQATQSVIGEREKKSRVERLSQLILKMKSDFKDVEL